MPEFSELSDDQRHGDDGFSLAARRTLIERGVGELAERMGITILELSASRAVATMPVEGNRQPAGILHGGAHLVLGETLGSFAANVWAGDGAYAVGIEINATHTRSVTHGMVTGTCTAIHLGGTMTTHEIVVRDEEGNRLSTVRISNLIRTRS